MILVAGGTGSLGRFIVARLAEHGEPIRILSRSPGGAAVHSSDKVEIVSGDLRDPSAIARAADGVRVIVAAATGFARPGADPRSVDFLGNSNLIEAAEKRQVERFVLISVRGARQDHPLELFRMKYLAEQRLRTSKIAWTILRPSAFMETWIGIVGAPLLKTGKTLVFGRGDNPINFVSAHDVGALVERAVLDPALAGATIEVAGPENLSFNQFVNQFATLTGTTASVRHVPRLMLRAGAWLMRPVNPRVAAMNQAALVMDTADLTFEVGGRDRSVAGFQQTTLADAVKIWLSASRAERA